VHFSGVEDRADAGSHGGRVGVRQH
jgi:hypothetical protein